jgi:hypothetical protein
MAPRSAGVRGAKTSTQSTTRAAWLCVVRAAPETRVDALSGEARSIALERETENDGDNAGGRQQTLNYTYQEPRHPQPPRDLQNRMGGVVPRDPGRLQRLVRDDARIQQRNRQQNQKADPRESPAP